jgi:hypothetical protein
VVASLNEPGLGEKRTHSGQQFMVVRISQAAFLSSCDRCSKGGEEDDILWILLQYVLEAFLDEACHCGSSSEGVSLKPGNEDVK